MDAAVTQPKGGARSGTTPTQTHRDHNRNGGRDTTHDEGHNRTKGTETTGGEGEVDNFLFVKLRYNDLILLGVNNF